MRQPYYDLESLEANNSVGYLVKRCGVLITQVAERRFQSLPISFSQWLVLIHLAQQEHISATQLSEHIGYDMGALTRVVDELERRGFARRERSRRDRRAVEIAVTAAGRREALSGKRVVVELLNRLVEPFADREIDAMVSLLQRMHGRLQEILAPKEPAAPPPTLAALNRLQSPRRKSASRGAA